MVLSMIVPLADYLTGVRTTFVGVITRHPSCHLVGFFSGLSVARELFLLLSPRLLSGVLS